MVYAQSVSLFVALYLSFLLAVRAVVILSPNPTRGSGGIETWHGLLASLAWAVFFLLVRL